MRTLLRLIAALLLAMAWLGLCSALELRVHRAQWSGYVGFHPGEVLQHAVPPRSIGWLGHRVYVGHPFAVVVLSLLFWWVAALLLSLLMRRRPPAQPVTGMQSTDRAA